MSEDNNHVIPVQDRKAEASISLNTLLTGLILAVTTGVGAWVGVNIEQIKKDVNAFSISIAVMQTDYKNLDREYREHARDPFAHHKPQRSAP